MSELIKYGLSALKLFWRLDGTAQQEADYCYCLEKTITIGVVFLLKDDVVETN